MDDSKGLRGNLHAVEYLLGQLFVRALDGVDDPQSWLKENAEEAKRKIYRENSLPPVEKDSGYGTVRRVMETASIHFEAAGKGPMIDLR